MAQTAPTWDMDYAPTALVPLGQLIPAPWNPRFIKDVRFKQLCDSLQADPQFLWDRPVLANAHGIIYGGNMRWRAAQHLGWQAIPARVTEVDDKQAKERALRDNNNFGEYEDQALAEMLVGLQMDGSDLRLLGFPDDELTRLLESVGVLGDTPVPMTTSGGAVFPDDAVLDAAFAHFRTTGFPYRRLPLHICMQEINRLAIADAESLLSSTLGYHVADTYHPHRVAAAAVGFKSPLDAFGDDGLLRRTLGLYQTYGGSIGEDLLGKLSIVSGVQACPNFRPGFAVALYRAYCAPGATVLDTSTGYGGRLVGFMASGIAGRYIGIDPNIPTDAGNRQMAADLGFTDRVELHNLPVEDVSHDLVAGRCDFAFTSPPYFAKEHYSDADTQSWVRYQTGEDWRDGFLLPMLRLQYAALRPDACAIVNIADVTIKGQVYPLVTWTRECSRAVGFDYVRQDEFRLTNRMGAGQADEVRTEAVLVFRKPGDSLIPRRVEAGA